MMEITLFLLIVLVNSIALHYILNPLTMKNIKMNMKYFIQFMVIG